MDQMIVVTKQAEAFLMPKNLFLSAVLQVRRG